MDTYNFQYCQKIVVYSQDMKSVLLCKRRNEADFDGVFSFIGGKMENTDESILEGLRREKNEEVGENCQIRIYTDFSTNIFFKKSDGSSMILPHYLAVFEQGTIHLSEEYSEFQWVALSEINSFEPKIPSIPEILEKLTSLKELILKKEGIII